MQVARFLFAMVMVTLRLPPTEMPFLKLFDGFGFLDVGS